MRRILFAALLSAGTSLLAPALPAAAQETVGIVRNSAGTATVIREAQSLTAAAKEYRAGKAVSLRDYLKSRLSARRAG